jgi:hypothetical protein
VRFAAIVLALGLGRLGAEVPADWAFRPVERPTIPHVSTTDCRNPIDRFVAERLAAAGRAFAPPADRITLIRRLTFDLIGLPPTPEEVDAFICDTSADAYERLVDRLLNSPHYGERQARWWLDLVRFAESDGFKADELRPQAWRYRDYVIRSFNADKPYDRFIREQLAGDELFPEDPDAWIATGFLRHYPVENNAVNLEQRRQEILNDITDTTGLAFLGLTLGCARCHDHKADPIGQTDYYRIQAFFAGWWPVDRRIDNTEEALDWEKARQQWESATAEIRRRLAELEAPFRRSAEAKERQRFIPEYANLIDIPPQQRTPWQKQIARMVEEQVFNPQRDLSGSMTGKAKEQWLAMKKQMAQWDRLRPPPIPSAMACTDVGTIVPETRLLHRGDWRKPQQVVEPGFLTAIDSRPVAIEPTNHGTSGRRKVLADWIASATNPLTARVLVNRVWQEHFGRGLVATPNDFGSQGERPTHPKLLDWLATEFVERGWRIKELHRLIVTSRTYQQSSQAGDLSLDPENRLLGRFSRRRLDAEAIRDSLLSAAGRLSTKLGGPSVFPELPAELRSSWNVTPDLLERDRRSVYVVVKRNLRLPLLSVFDAPEAAESCGRRFVTTTAPQALHLLNDPQVLRWAEHFAQRVRREAGEDPDAQILRACRVAWGRTPDADERRWLREFVNRRGLVDLCHVLVNTNEFVYLD